MTAPTAPLTMAIPHIVATTGNQQKCVVDVVVQWVDVDPHAVRLICTSRGGHTEVWLVDRDMLAQGLDMPVGVGDISIMPDLARRDGLAIELVFALIGRGVGYNLSLPLLITPLRRFLDRTYTAVPADAELDVDPAELAGGAAA